TASILFSGTDESGVIMTVSVVDSPGPSDTVLSPVTFRPVEAAAVSVIDSGSLPTLLIEIVSLAATPGTAFNAAGLLASATASIAGTVNVSVCDRESAGLVVLVAVTVNESWVPGAGTWLFGTR